MSLSSPTPSPMELSSLNLPFIEELYARFLRDPDSIDPAWRAWFESFAAAEGAPPRAHRGPSFQPPRLFQARPEPNGHRYGPTELIEEAHFQHRVEKLVRSYRMRGHEMARLDPLERPRPVVPELDPAYCGLTDADLARRVSKRTIFGPEELTFGDLLERLRNTYCRFIGVQFMHIDELNVKKWLMERMEKSENRIALAPADQLRILTKLTDAVIFEEFIQKKYVGAKSFSLEGAESLIPLLDLAIEKAGQDGIAEIVLAMPHRGRLNVLANVMGKHPRQIFREFEDQGLPAQPGRGDVKYHLGYSCDWVVGFGRTIHLSLCFNPSHLEFVNPVALGRTRAKQDRHDLYDPDQCMALLIHGDAAFAGEGIVQETLNLSQLPAYTVGGTLHVIVNNQIGFTTPPEQARSSPYATAVAKMLQIPIFHVNGEDPEAVAQVVHLALDFRRTFRRDVVIDMYSYRRRGHNEGDEPTFTQPVLYRALRHRPSVRQSYRDHLLKLGGLTLEQAETLAEERRARLESELKAAREEPLYEFCEVPRGRWSGYRGGDDRHLQAVRTGPERRQLSHLLRRLAAVPDGFHLHPKLRRFLDQRLEMAEGSRPLDWAAAEALAFATLAVQGFRVRLTGQDSERGTFSQRHAVFHDYDDGTLYRPFQHLAETQGPVEIHNSPLSEAGVLGFEYGYSLDCPDGLVAWEAQFGDFWNVAQVIVDQFIASAEDKWRRLSGLVLLLPHGFEGMGPEHSSARLERFLLLAADMNLQVAQPTTPAQYFHLLRRQVLRKWRKPLIVMTPKSLLRHPDCVSSLQDLAEGAFRNLLPDPEPPARPVGRVILSSGKIYYELRAQRRERASPPVALVRLEQLYPLSEAELAEALKPYGRGTPVLWVQEEPENMGAWRYLRSRFGERLPGDHPLSGMFRPAAASPATGSLAIHKLEQEAILAAAFDLGTGSQGEPNVRRVKGSTGRQSGRRRRSPLPS